MNKQERKIELTPQQLEALKMLIGPGPLRDRFFSDPGEATHARRWMEIPATSVLPTNLPSIDKQLNVIKTAIYESIPDGEIPFNPVREYHTYCELFNLGLVDMIPQQGSKTVKVEITPEGAGKLGRKLVERE